MIWKKMRFCDAMGIDHDLSWKTVRFDQQFQNSNIFTNVDFVGTKWDLSRTHTYIYIYIHQTTSVIKCSKCHLITKPLGFHWVNHAMKMVGKDVIVSRSQESE